MNSNQPLTVTHMQGRDLMVEGKVFSRTCRNCITDFEETHFATLLLLLLLAAALSKTVLRSSSTIAWLRFNLFMTKEKHVRLTDD